MSRFKTKLDIQGPISATEYKDAFHYLVYLDQNLHFSEVQNKDLVAKKVSVQLTTIKISVEYYILGGRVKKFPVCFCQNTQIPVLPYGKLAQLVVLYYHNRHHRDVDTIVTMVRNNVWPVKVRKLASAMDSKCVDYKVKRKKLAERIYCLLFL